MSKIVVRVAGESAEALLAEWKRLTKGVPTHVVARAMTSTDRGVNWTGSTKERMREAFVGDSNSRAWSIYLTAADRAKFAAELVTAKAQYEGARERRLEEERREKTRQEYQKKREAEAEKLCTALEEHHVITRVTSGQWPSVHLVLELEDARKLLESLKRERKGT